jgi:hypothetical protein
MLCGRNGAQFRQFAVERAWASRAPPPHSANSGRVCQQPMLSFVCEAGFCAVIGNGRIRNEHHELGM